MFGKARLKTGICVSGVWIVAEDLISLFKLFRLLQKGNTKEKPFEMPIQCRRLSLRSLLQYSNLIRGSWPLCLQRPTYRQTYSASNCIDQAAACMCSPIAPVTFLQKRMMYFLSTFFECRRTNPEKKKGPRIKRSFYWIATQRVMQFMAQ